MLIPDLILLFCKGIIVGFVIAAPVGPIGILCIRRTLSGNFPLGILTGIGAGLADTFYGAVAAFSLATIADFIKHYNFYIRLFGGLLLIWFGIALFRASPRQEKKVKGENTTLFHGLTSGFFLTLSNPVTLLVFAIAFAAIGVDPHQESFSQATALVMGVFVGATAWWLSLCTTVHMIHHKLSDTQLLWINRVSGGMLFLFAIYVLLSLV